MFLQPPTKSDSSTEGDRCSIMNNQDLLWEVLVRLPTKSLMRFKCVSKLWYSIICNHKFAIAHNGRGSATACFRGLLIIRLSYGKAQRFFYANFNNRPRLMHCQMTIHESDFRFTKVVKGLIGFYKDDQNIFTLCNIATHELLNFPPSPFSKADSNDYLLGFDPFNEVYKVLKIRLQFHNAEEYNNLSYVFTLGVNNSDIQWRRISPPPLDLYCMSDEYLCICGTMYWLTCDVDAEMYQQILIVFNLSSETFETISIPKCIQDSCVLVEICGSPSLIVIHETRDYDGMLDIWTMKNHRKGDDLEVWSRKKVLFPISLEQAWRLNYGGTLPTGEMILIATSESRNFPLPIYVYDPSKNDSSSMTIESYESQESGLDVHENGVRMKICYYEENLISLDCLMNHQPKDEIST